MSFGGETVASLVQWSDNSSFTSKVPSSIPSKVDLNPFVMCNEYCQRSAQSRGFSPGTPVSSHREC